MSITARLLPCFLVLWMTSVVAAQRLEVQAVFDLAESEWSEFESISDPIHFPCESLLRICNRVGQRHVESFLQDQSTSDPDRLDSLKQGDAVHFSQNVQVESVQQIDSFYISRMKIADRFDAVCVSLQIPRGWDIAKFDSPQRSGFLGILLVQGKTPVFAASRLEWFPPTLLGNYGMDVALLDTVAPVPPNGITRENKINLSLTDTDSEPFYRLLTTAAKIPAQEINRNAPEKPPVVELFNRPQSQQGRLVRLAGYARRIERVNIDGPEITDRFGIDHYYQIAFFTEDSQGNPLFFCIPEIPSGLPLGDEEGFAVSLSISGFFYKTWAYRRSGSTENKSLTQLAPLLIGAKIDWFQPPEKMSGPARSMAPLYSSTFVFFGLALLWILLRRLRKRSQPLRFSLENRNRNPE